MKRIVLGLLLGVFACSGAWAETSVWKARKGNATVYLGGTCHILRDRDYPLPPEFEKAYKASHTLVFETDIDQLQSPATQRKMLARATYSDGSGVDKHLSPRVYTELNAFCAANGIALEAFKQFKPPLLMVTLTVLELAKLGTTQQGVDLYFHARARKDGKAVRTLETVDEQIDFMVTMADGGEDEFVSYSLKDMGALRENYDALVSSWRAGDAGKLNALMITEMRTDQPALYRKLLVDRNKAWLPLIDGYLATPGAKFILVGVGHLVGPDGLVEALKKKGYKVEKL